MTMDDKDLRFAQEVYTGRLQDENLKCTCDDKVRDTEIFKAKGHYHHCMLFQVARAIERTIVRSKGRVFGRGKCKCKHEEGAHVFDRSSSFCAIDGCPCQSFEGGKA